MLTIDTVLQNRYRIVQQLGQGGMGAVYKAIDERLNKTVAIKEVIIEPEAAHDETQRNLIQRTFQREATSLVKARHEAVPDITDYFSDFPKSYLVMEYVEGDDLAKMLEKRGKPFSFEEVLPWIIQLLEALEYLHNLVPPILHRDIKPQNLKLNERQKIKLLDFGIARSADKNSTITQHTFLAATLNYAPLEQVLRVISPVFREYVLLKYPERAEKFFAQDTDARCDIFGVGATFYHLLTNQIPLDVTERALGIWEKGTDELVNPSQINPEIPPRVSEWLLKALAFERENRFTSASEMKEALQKITAESNENFAITGQQARRDEFISTRDQQLMQAETISLIESQNTEGAIFNSDKMLSTAGSEGRTEPVDFKLSNTDFPVQSPAGNLTGQSYIVENQFNTQKELLAPQSGKIIPPHTEKSSTNNRKYILILLIMGLLVFAVSGAGIYAVVYLTRHEKNPKENNTATENKAISQTPETTPSVNENVNTTQGNTQIYAGTNTETTPNTARTETSKTPIIIAQPSVTPTGKIMTEQTTTPTPTAKPTPTTKPTVTATPSIPNLIDHVLCYVKSTDGTINKIRKNRCNECPQGVACEIIFKNP